MPAGEMKLLPVCVCLCGAEKGVRCVVAKACQKLLLLFLLSTLNLFPSRRWEKRLSCSTYSTRKPGCFEFSKKKLVLHILMCLKNENVESDCKAKDVNDSTTVLFLKHHGRVWYSVKKMVEQLRWMAPPSTSLLFAINVSFQVFCFHTFRIINKPRHSINTPEK